MTIRVIQQTTSERRQETKELYEQCKPLLDQGYSLFRAVKETTGRNGTNTKNGWYRDLIDYAISQGFDYHKNKRC